jgi:hypothetical protein
MLLMMLAPSCSTLGIGEANIATVDAFYGSPGIWCRLYDSLLPVQAPPSSGFVGYVIYVNLKPAKSIIADQTYNVQLFQDFWG